MYDRTISEKISNIIVDSFEQLNDVKRSYLIADSHSNGEMKDHYELTMLKQLLQLELSIRKIQKLNNASIAQEKHELVAEHKKNYRSNGSSHLKSV